MQEGRERKREDNPTSVFFYGVQCVSYFLTCSMQASVDYKKKTEAAFWALNKPGK